MKIFLSLYATLTLLFTLPVFAKGPIQSCLDLISSKYRGQISAYIEAQSQLMDDKISVREFVNELLAAPRVGDVSGTSDLAQEYSDLKADAVVGLHTAINNPLPSLYNEGKEDDTYGLMMSLIRGNPGEEAYDKAKVQLDSYIRQYESFESDLRLITAQAKTSLDFLITGHELRYPNRPWALGNLKRPYDRKDFKDKRNGQKRVTQKLTSKVYHPDGKTEVDSEHEWDHWRQFIVEYRQHVNNVRAFFGVTPGKKFYRRGSIAARSKKQALLYKRIKMIRDELETRGIYNFQDHHRKLAGQLSDILKNKSTHPLQDDLNAVTDLELRAEIYNYWVRPSFLLNRARDNSRFSISLADKALLKTREGLQKVIHSARHFVNLGIFAGFASAAALATHHVIETSWIGVKAAELQGYGDELTRSVFHATAAEVNWALNEAWHPLFRHNGFNQLMRSYEENRRREYARSNGRNIDEAQIEREMLNYSVHLLDLEREYGTKRFSDIANQVYPKTLPNYVRVKVAHIVSKKSGFPLKEIEAIFTTEEVAERRLLAEELPKVAGKNIVAVLEYLDENEEALTLHLSSHSGLTDEQIGQIHKALKKPY